MMIEEAFVPALRKEEWKYIEPCNKDPEWLRNKKIETGLMEQAQLFNLRNDIEEQHNVIDQYPDKAKEIKKTIGELIGSDLTRASQNW